MKGHTTLRIFKWLSLAILALFTIPASAQQECSVTWTLDGDFDDGVAINLGTGDGDELVLNTFTTPLPFVYVACSGRGTAVRIDVNTGAILGEYLTAPTGMGRDPSRTTVDKFGNCWVANRAEGGFSGGEAKGSMMRIGVIIGGTRGNKNGDGSFTDDPAGQYLRPPFLYSTVTDRDGDGYIKTSKGLGNILAWTNAGGANTHGGVSTADDEAIINYTRVAGANARTVAVDANNDVWTGGLGDLDHEKISGVTGLPIAGTKFNTGCGAYGGLIDGNNVLWSARGGSNLLRYDANSPVPPGAGSIYSCIGPAAGDYGLGIDPATGNIWSTTLAAGVVKVLNPAGGVIGSFGHGNTFAQGVAVDASGNVWVAHSLVGGFTTVGHLRTTGTYVGNVALGADGSGPTGVAVDANGKIWVTNYYSNTVKRIDPSLGPIGGGGFPVGAVDLTVGLGAGASPYNYSDMTGFVSLGASSPSGTWTVVQDGGVVNGEWGLISWIGSEPEGTEIKVEVRVSNSQIGLAAEDFVEVENGVSFCDLGLLGQFIEIRVTLSRSSGDNTPVLSEVSVGCCNEPPVAACRDIEVEANENCFAEVTPEQIDNGSDDPDGTDPENELEMSISPEGPFGLGVHPVMLTVTDADGATDECSATVTVVDGTDPVISGVGADEAIECPASPVFSEPTASDNCDDEVLLTYVDSPVPDCGNTYTITRTWTATDDAGNTSEASQSITVADVADPDLTMSTTAINPWPANHSYTTVTTADIVAAVGDACDDVLSLSDVIITGVTSDEPEDATGNGDGSTLNDIVIASDCKSVDLRSERSGGGNGRVYRIHIAVTDICGNTSIGSFPVSIRANNGGGSVAVEDAPAYTVDGTCGGASKLVMPGVTLSEGYVLGQNVPNPFSQLTEIPFAIGNAGHVTINIFDGLGKRMATVLDAQCKAGSQSVSFAATGMQSGTYYCVLESNGVKLVRRITISK